jgi:hypothetical protein
VQFDRNVDKCYSHADSFSAERTIVVQPRDGTLTGVYVDFVNPTGDLTDTKFYLTVTC